AVNVATGLPMSRGDRLASPENPAVKTSTPMAEAIFQGPAAVQAGDEFRSSRFQDGVANLVSGQQPRLPQRSTGLQPCQDGQQQGLQGFSASIPARHSMPSHPPFRD